MANHKRIVEPTIGQANAPVSDVSKPLAIPSAIRFPIGASLATPADVDAAVAELAAATNKDDHRQRRKGRGRPPKAKPAATEPTATGPMPEPLKDELELVEAQYQALSEWQNVRHNYCTAARDYYDMGKWLLKVREYKDRTHPEGVWGKWLEKIQMNAETARRSMLLWQRAKSDMETYHSGVWRIGEHTINENLRHYKIIAPLKSDEAPEFPTGLDETKNAAHDRWQTLRSERDAAEAKAKAGEKAVAQAIADGVAKAEKVKDEAKTYAKNAKEKLEKAKAEIEKTKAELAATKAELAAKAM